MDLKFTPTRVNTDTTSHYCQTFKLPTDKDYHFIGVQALVDNFNVTHHISTRLCPGDTSKSSLFQLTFVLVYFCEILKSFLCET